MAASAVVVIGGGQAGLAAGYWLKQAGVDFVILDAAARTGDAWRERWDSLKLFTPAEHDGLPGLPFPAKKGSFPTRAEAADYLEGYARQFALPIEHGARVLRVTRSGDEFRVESANGARTARSVIVATGTNQLPKVPAFAAELSKHIAQLHASEYRRPGSVPAGKVLVAGFGASGAELARELAQAGREVWISGKPTPHIPRRLLDWVGGLYWRLLHHVLTLDTPIGRKIAPNFTAHGAPLIGLDPREVIAAGARPVPRVAGVREGKPLLEDGQVLDADAVIWCTGFRPDYRWLELPELSCDPRGWPLAPHGVMSNVPGLYFMGVPFQTGLTSGLLGGVGRDAARVVKHLTAAQASLVTRAERSPAPLPAP